MNRILYQKATIKQMWDGEPQPFCHSCGNSNPLVLQDHHIFGRENSDITVPLCRNCHALITAEQNKIPPYARSFKAKNDYKVAYFFISIGSLLKLIGQQLVNMGRMVIENA